MRPDGPGFREVGFTYYALKLLEITFAQWSIINHFFLKQIQTKKDFMQYVI